MSIPAERRTEMLKKSENRVSKPWLSGWKPLYLWFPLFVLMYVGVRIYQQHFAWYAGLDSQSPEFALWWRGLFYVEVIATGIFAGAWWGWLIRSGRKVDKNPSREEEVRRIAVFWSLVGMLSFNLFMAASFFLPQDAAWHQTAVRDSALTPSHVPLFFLNFPMGIALSVGMYLYGRTRLPAIYGPEKGFPWSFMLLICSSVLLLAQVAANEWGHSFWIVEEIFSAPVHWGFTWYGWLAAAMFALWGETIMRLLNLDMERDKELKSAKTPEASYSG